MYRALRRDTPYIAPRSENETTMRTLEIPKMDATDKLSPESTIEVGNATSPRNPIVATQETPQLNTEHEGELPIDSHGTLAMYGRLFISPIARRLAEEHHLDYTNIEGTGPNGRIIKMDIEATLAQQQPRAPLTQTLLPCPTEPRVQPALAPEERSEDEEIAIPLAALSSTIAPQLSQNIQSAPHFYMTSVIDTNKLAALRQQINNYTATEPTPIKVGFTDLIVKAVARALVRIPQMNVSFTEEKLMQHQHVHIGIAIPLKQGQIVPILHNAPLCGILDIARETQRLAEAARIGKLCPEHLTGGTFTVSNLGMFNIDSFSAIINPPEAAILAIGAITPTPTVVDGQVVIRDHMKVTLTCDHRAIDGATAARFLREIKRLLEEPLGLLL